MSGLGQGTTVEGRTISIIEFDPSAQPLPVEELRQQILPLREGQPLHLADVRTAIQGLYLTGRYRDIQIDADPDGDQVRIHIITEFNFFVSGVTVNGESEPPNASQVVTAAKLQLGVAVLESDIEQATRNIVERLRANGLYQATVTSRVDRTPATQEAGVFFEIDTGERARFDGVRISGEALEPEPKLIHTTGWHRQFAFIPLPGWRELTESRLQNGIQNILRDLQKRDRLQGRVVLDALDYKEASNTVTPQITITPGPLIEVRTTGDKVSNSRLRQLIPVYQERTVDRSLLIEGRRNLLEYFESRGYFETEVEFTQSQPEAGRSVIEYSINRGARHRLVNIEIAGNKYFDTPTLRERMYMAPVSFFRNRYGRFSQRILEQDKDTIRDLYRANGFRDAEVTSSISDDYEGKLGNLGVSLSVTEGPQWLVNTLEIAGVPPEDEEYLRGILQSTEGQPFSEATVAADRDSILSYYYNNGYPDAAFDWTQTDGPEPNRVNLRFEIKPGERQYVRGILVSGLKDTNPDLVNERILLGPGDAMSQSRIGESQQKLYDLGIFSKVQTALQNPEGQEQSKYVILHVDEARKYSLNFGFGAELARFGGGTTTLNYPAGRAGFSPRVSIGISRINFLGLGHTVGFQTQTSTIRQRALLNYLAPQFKGNENLSLTFTALFDRARDIRTFDSRRWEGSVQMAQRLSRANALQYRFTYRRVTVDAVKIEPGLIPLLAQPVRVGQVSGTFIQDRRDDPIDSHRGIYNTVDLAFAHKAFASETDFTRLLIRNSMYHRLGKDLVLARTAQFGYMQRYGGLSQIPLAERFFAGGPSSHRAFPANQAGPRDLSTGFPLGGSALLFHSTELRFPLFGENIGGVLFHDMGNVYTDIKKISFRAIQRSRQDFDYMIHGVGLGVRYRTPVGPVRVDLSFSPNSPRFIGLRGTLDQLANNQGQIVDQRISRFQFHFSLGQTF